MVKSLAAPYAAGRRGSAWIKVKTARSLDLVVLAVEWGSGRRKGWLSNLHLGARDPNTGGFVMLGKTFKGMTDEMLAVADDGASRSGNASRRPHRVRAARSSSSRSRSTRCSAARSIPAVSRCASRA